MPLAALRPTQEQALYQYAMGDTALACFGQIPWIHHLGVRQARQRQSNDVLNDGDDGDSNGSSTTRMAVTMATMTKVMWTAMAATTTTTATMTLTMMAMTMGRQ